MTSTAREHAAESSRTARAAPFPRMPDSQIRDLRFRALVGEEAWARLPEAVRRRFSKRLADGEAVVYQGRVVSTELSRWGRVLAAAATLIGGPLPRHGTAGAAVVVVTEDKGLGGQSWTRTYARPGRFPQVVHSAKRFCGPTGLEEYVGAGIGMTLRVTVEEGALFFRSERYFLALGRFRLNLPRWLSPGAMEIVHREEPGLAGEGYAFSFRLALIHPRLGALVSQLAYFRDP